MKWMVFAAGIWLAGFVACGRQPGTALRNLTPTTVGPFTAVDRGKVYDETGIYDYMDGAAEIYKQYDYRRLFVRRYQSREGRTFLVELFQFGSPAEAYGIYSHLFDGDSVDVGQGGFWTGTAAGFWKGPYFGYLRWESPGAEQADVLLEAARRVAAAISETGEPPKWVNRFPEEGLQRVRYFHDYVLLNAHVFLSTENVLNLGKGTEVFLAEYQTEFRGNDFQPNVLLVIYPDEARARDAAARARTEVLKWDESESIGQIARDLWGGVRQKRNFLILVTDAPERKWVSHILDALRSEIQREMEGLSS
jgi:hypothetical protein